MQPAQVTAFLDAVRKLGKIAPAARRVGVSASTIYAAKAKDADLAAAIEAAQEECYDDLEVALVERARDGHREVVIHQGQVQWQTEPILDDEGAVALDENGRVRQRLALGPDGRPQPLYVLKPSDSNLQFALRHYRRFVERTELTGANGAPLVPEESPADQAKRIAFALALGLKAAKQAKSVADPDDIT
jgi:hypothetical protein